ncbi:hypothetical protein [Pseudoalteromonas peptidolytica]|uniref:hypothetical protein n=1 Tax=Pseudoalteromonas peptidolytica TaxID=61150 RepID=UPI00298D6F78|nr:hypothetical protein [Pseudoalteromonas peptidolytica]MDW7547737.1 hypothetical protein [Pseudoalteromonas peptidolytica]
MIEAKLALTGRITGFRTGDKTIDLNWRSNDAKGTFERKDMLRSENLEIKIPVGATVLMFSPGEIEDTRQQAHIEAKNNVENAKEELEQAKGDPTVDNTPLEEKLEQAEKALKDAKANLEKELQKAELSLLAGTAMTGLNISSTDPTVLSFDGTKAQSLTLKTTENMLGCEIVIL